MPERACEHDALRDLLHQSGKNSLRRGFRAARKTASMLMRLLSPSMPSIRILLANHQPIIRSGLRLLLEREPQFRIVAEAANGHEAVVLTEFKHPEVAILDVRLSHLNGIAVAKEISSKQVRPKTVFVTTDTDESYVVEAFKAGASGYVAADSAPADLVRAIHVVVGGHLFLSPTICLRCLDGHASTRDLSEHQKQLWCLLAAGYSQGEMATHLNADPNTIENDCKTIRNTLHCDPLQNSIANAVFAVKQLLSLPPKDRA